MLTFQLKVTGNNLSGVCKLIFKVAKNDKNDHLFLQKNVLGNNTNSITKKSDETLNLKFFRAFFGRFRPLKPSRWRRGLCLRLRLREISNNEPKAFTKNSIPWNTATYGFAFKNRQ